MSEAIGVQRTRLPFTMIENAPFEDRALSKSDLIVYWTLCYHADRAGKCFPSLALVCAEARISRRGVTKSLRNLVSRGFLSVASRMDPAGDRETNLYTIRARRRGGVGQTGNYPVGQTGNEGGANGLLEPYPLNQIRVERPSAEASPPPAKKGPKTPHGRVRALFSELYRKSTSAARAPFNAACAGQLRNDLSRLGEDRLKRAFSWLFAHPPARMGSFGYMALHTFLPEAEKALAAEDRRLSMVRVCPGCGREQEHTGADCLFCGQPLKGAQRVG